MNLKIADNIRIKRLQKGYKQETLALECNMTQANISHIENGKVKPSEEGIERIALALGTTAEILKYGRVEVKYNQDENTIYDDLLKEFQQCQTLNKLKDETIKAQTLTIDLLKAELERLKERS
jgi:transcriptional regulator with XRE-family HTH domain